MSIRTKNASYYLQMIILICVFTFLGLFSVVAAEEPTDKALEWKIDNFRMHLGLELKEDFLQEITAEDRANKVVELGNWPHAPMEVVASIANGDVRIRDEKDFVVIWYHSPVSLINGNSTPLDVIRDVTNNFLDKAFVIGEDATLSITGTNSFGNPKAELRTSSLPKEISGTEAITFCYSPISRRKEPWKYVDTISVLVKEKDAIIVMEKLKARTALDKPIHEGLIAAKVRLTEEETEKAKDKPILARNVIFGGDVDTKDVPDSLLNGCMWPIDNKILTGAKDVGLANELLLIEPKKPIQSDSK